MVGAANATHVVAGMFFLLFGLYAYRKDRAVRAGHDRNWLALYHDRSVPFWMRNAALVAPFAGAMGVAWGLGILTFFVTSVGRMPELPGALLFVGFGVVGTIAMLLFLIGAYRAPESQKPDWLRRDEHKEGGSAAQTRTDTALLAGIRYLPLTIVAFTLGAGAVLFVGAVA